MLPATDSLTEVLVWSATRKLEQQCMASLQKCLLLFMDLSPWMREPRVASGRGHHSKILLAQHGSIEATWTGIYLNRILQIMKLQALTAYRMQVWVDGTSPTPPPSSPPPPPPPPQSQKQQQQQQQLLLLLLLDTTIEALSSSSSSIECSRDKVSFNPHSCWIKSEKQPWAMPSSAETGMNGQLGSHHSHLLSMLAAEAPHDLWFQEPPLEPVRLRSQIFGSS